MIKATVSMLLILILVSACNAPKCNQLPVSFETYAEAISLIKSSSFSLNETANTSGSSWIKSAQYFSCDDATGYFIYRTNDGKEYIHNEVPADIWDGFKNANSKGAYYDSHIKGRYRLKLN